jgi:5-methyltetrahydrofolate corrinoid/iron sulfur protein methyltransferase
MRLSEALKDKSKFVVVAELTGGPDFNSGPIEKFLKAYKEAGSAVIPPAFNFVGITSPQNPGGVANIEPADVLSNLKSKDLLGELDFIPHISCKDQNSNSLISSLAGFKKAGAGSVLALTGDKPIKAKGVFEMDSIGLLNLVRYTNNEQYIKSKPEELDKVFQFFAGAAVSPFKYTESSQMQQYYKMGKKILCGAQFFITQVGWDWKKSAELFRYVKEAGLDAPIIGNVYFLSTLTAAPRLMHDIKLTGCFVSDELLAKIYSEKVDDHIERAAQQVAMYKSLGAAGVDIAGVSDFAMFTRILERAYQIGDNWQQYKDNLCWPKKDGFYLYDETGKKAVLTKYPKKFKHRFFNFFHRAILNSDYHGFYVFRKIMSALGTRKGKGAIYKLFNASEKSFKYMLFDCQECGDCYLPENFGLCTIGGCEKGLDNPPCGDATVEGYCGNNLDLVCIGELIYQAASSEKGGIEKLRATINQPRNPALEHTASILNYLFSEDHTRKNYLISIGETIHASIPRTGKIIKQLAQLGPDAFDKPSGPLNYIRALIESQVAEGADYIAVNLDVLGEQNPQIAVETTRQYVHLLHRWSQGVPICFDSSSNDVLIAGLKEWYNTDKPVRPPLINSVKVYTMDKILPLKKHYDFAFIGLLIGEDKPKGPGGSHSVDELYGFAQRIYESAVGKYGFKPQEIFFDSTVFPLAIDMPMQPNVPGYTYRAFETIKKIRADKKMKGVHCSLGVSNSVRELPGRKIGVCRAYVAKAVEYGLDAAILNTAHRYGFVEPDPELVRLVDAFAKMDGSADRLNDATKLMGKFCRECRRPAK